MDKMLLTQWTGATAELSWGVAKVFRDALTLVADEKVTLVYGADYLNGRPCLVNSVGQMLQTGGGRGIPSHQFGPVVSLFDQINGALEIDGVNTTDRTVSPLAAEILLRHFAPEKEQTMESKVQQAMSAEAFGQNVYTEPTDEDVARDWLNSLQAKQECEEANWEDVVKVDIAYRAEGE